jgi:hypothetical protein
MQLMVCFITVCLTCVLAASTCTKLATSKASSQKNTELSYPVGRRGHTALMYGNSMYIFGGYVDMKGSSSELWQYHIGRSPFLSCWIIREKQQFNSMIADI